MKPHKELCERAVRWLRGTKRCDPVLSGIASTVEVPDAIGWGSSGSIVVECKTSILNFYADKEKYVRYRHLEHGNWLIRGNGRGRDLLKDGYERVDIPSMGDYRYFLCEPGILERAHVEERPDHGLLHAVGRTIRVVVPAKLRTKVNYEAEIRCLRFALVHLHSNLLNIGCSVNLEQATKWRGESGISLPI